MLSLQLDAINLNFQYFQCSRQWHSHWGVKEGQSATPDSEKFSKNREKEGESQEKEEKSGRFFHFVPPDK